MVLYTSTGRAAWGLGHQFTGWSSYRSTPFTSERLVTGTLPTVITGLANGSKGRVAVFQVGYSTNMRFRWIVLRGQFSTTMI